MADLSVEEARKLLAGVVIPPRPTVVTAVLEERARPEPDLKRVAALIGGDVGLSAAVLKTVNSPLYGLRRQVSGIEQAVNMLGMNNVGALVTGLALRNAVPAQGLERFWDGATRTALIASYLAKQLGCTSREDAHLFGLFHDCGIPLLMQRFPDYRDTLRQANQEHGRAFTDVEDERHATNHAVVGGLLASNWHLPDHLREAIRAHHDLAVFQSGLSSAAMNLVAIGLLAEYIESGHSRLAGDGEWDKLGGAVMAHLMMDADAVEELSRDAREMLEESGL
jgi:HD-like signal output (HDOD) protein